MHHISSHLKWGFPQTSQRAGGRKEAGKAENPCPDLGAGNPRNVALHSQILPETARETILKETWKNKSVRANITLALVFRKRQAEREYTQFL